MSAASHTGPTSGVLLQVRDLRTHFPIRTGVLKAVDGVSFDVERGKTLCIFLVDEGAVGGELHTDAVANRMFDDLEEVAAHHWFATADVDVEHLQVPQLVEYRKGLWRGEFARVALAAAGQAVDALQIACVGEFPREADGGIEPALHLGDKAASGHSGSPTV